MARLRPYPFGALVRRMFRELEQRQSIFDLPSRSFFNGVPGRDLSVHVHGHLASTPLGPAAGPQSQLAQNIVLSWLGGCRVIELKTVQINDRLEIPRPCIDMETVGFNVEWSQELTLEESLEEYAKASMLVTILAASGRLPAEMSDARTIYDMSVGYDLAGIRSERVQAFLHGMLDATSAIDRLRHEISDEYRQYRDLDFATRLSDTLTLSTFHGCPSREIEQITDFLLRNVGLHVTVKLNPMLLGPAETDHLLHEVLGYHELRVPPSAFERDTTWDEAVAFSDRLGRTAAALGRGFGVKFTNTLIVENHRGFFPADQPLMYLSGPPLHVLAMQLVRRFRREFGDRYPISFSGGIDRVNFADAVAIGLVPVTVCTDLLKPGGYARARGYLLGLRDRMAAAGASGIGDFVLRAYGLGLAALGDMAGAGRPARTPVAQALAEGGDLRALCGDDVYARWVSRAAVLNTEAYVERATADPRYGREHNSRPPRKIGRTLKLFDCISCDKCVPVCPNDANFTFVLPQATITIVKVWQQNGAWAHRQEGTLAIEETHQIGNFADFCNDCGNCDVFCPEDGGPYVLKPRFFGSRQDWEGSPALDGFFVARDGASDVVLGRFSGEPFQLHITGTDVAYSGTGFELAFDESDPLRTLRGAATVPVDLTWYEIMNALRKAVLAPGDVNYVNSLF